MYDFYYWKSERLILLQICTSLTAENLRGLYYLKFARPILFHACYYWTSWRFPLLEIGSPFTLKMCTLFTIGNLRTFYYYTSARLLLPKISTPDTTKNLHTFYSWKSARLLLPTAVHVLILSLLSFCHGKMGCKILFSIRSGKSLLLKIYTASSQNVHFVFTKRWVFPWNQ